MIDLSPSVTSLTNFNLIFQQMALKLSGFKKPSYLNSRRLIEKLLDLNKPMGVSEIAIQLNLTEIQASSQTMLDRFVSSSDLRNIDTTHPQYGAMAVYQMCRLRKIKIQKTKLISFSHLKPSQWSVLEKSWESWTKANPDKIQDFLPLKKGKSAAQSTETTAAASNHGEEKSEPITKIVEEYEDWKERVLKKAFEDLERQKMVH